MFASVETSLFVALSLVCRLGFYSTPKRLIQIPVVANEGQKIDIPDGCILENSGLSFEVP